jgi:hypothetical protein
VLAVLLGALVAAVVPVSSAVAFLSSPQTWDVTVQQPVTLQARGAAVSVPVQVTCPTGAFASLEVSVTQRSGSGVVSGSRTREVNCTGSPELFTVNVLTASGSKVFKKGPAFVEAVLYGCGYACGVMDTDGRTVEISR